MVLIDTSIIITYLRKQEKSSTDFYHASLKYPLAISTITHYELMLGLREVHQPLMERIYAQLTIIPFDVVCADHAVKITHQLKARNGVIGLPDIYIAATALAHDIPLLTGNVRHFNRVDGLELITV
jgi:predicted nucleic acid-binding protein